MYCLHIWFYLERHAINSFWLWVPGENCSCTASERNIIQLIEQMQMFCSVSSLLSDGQKPRPACAISLISKLHSQRESKHQQQTWSEIRGTHRWRCGVAHMHNSAETAQCGQKSQLLRLNYEYQPSNAAQLPLSLGWWMPAGLSGSGPALSPYVTLTRGSEVHPEEKSIKTFKRSAAVTRDVIDHMIFPSCFLISAVLLDSWRLAERLSWGLIDRAS